MKFFRQYLAPLLVVLLFLVALVAVSARIFLPGDMALPAPVAEASTFWSRNSTQIGSAAGSVTEPGAALSLLVNGLPADLADAAQL
jgi:hypothetical protein